MADISNYHVQASWDHAGFCLFIERNDYDQTRLVPVAKHLVFATEEEAYDHARMLEADATDEEWAGFRAAQTVGYGGTFDKWLDEECGA